MSDSAKPETPLDPERTRKLLGASEVIPLKGKTVGARVIEAFQIWARRHPWHPEYKKPS